MKKNLIIICTVTMLTANGQKSESIYSKYDIHRSPILKVLNKFNWTITTGYSRTYYNHDLSDFHFIQTTESQYILPNSVTIDFSQFQGYQNWFNRSSLGSEVLDLSLSQDVFLVKGDTAQLGFRGITHGIPVSGRVHFNLFERFRLGFGMSWEKQNMTELSPISYSSQIRPYRADIKSTTFSRFYGMLGYRFYSYWEFLYVLELEYGNIKSGRGEFDLSSLVPSSYINIGLSIEKQFSEYFRIILKPSLDFKNYKINLPTGDRISHLYPTFFLQGGISINIPEIPRSPIKNDKTQVKHVITDPKSGRRIEVRGQPITKWQNPKVGQNHRKPWRLKSKNKKKINPF